jgi:hypothetical protein
MLDILLLAREYLLALRAFAIYSLEVFQKYSKFHAVNTRHKRDLHGPTANGTIYQKLVQHAGTKFYNPLAPNIKCSSPNSERFKISLKRVILIRNFYLAD